VRLEDVLRCLEAKAAKVAEEALVSPPDRSEFGFGKAVGTYAGISLAKEAILAMHEEMEERKQRM